MDDSDLFAEYLRSPTIELRNELVVRHLGIVCAHARVAAMRGDGNVGFAEDDLYQVGAIGLMKAVETWDPARHACFKTYAYYIVMYAILDEMRALDHLPRSARRLVRRFEKTREEMERSAGGLVVDDDVYDALPFVIGEVQSDRSRDQARLWANGPMSLDWCDENGDPISQNLSERKAADESGALDREIGRRWIDVSLGLLNDQERSVLIQYYAGGVQLKRIAEVLHVCSSRVSQIKTKAERLLRRRLLPRRHELMEIQWEEPEEWS